jgi:hypothetical protein
MCSCVQVFGCVTKNIYENVKTWECVNADSISGLQIIMNSMEIAKESVDS